MLTLLICGRCHRVSHCNRRHFGAALRPANRRPPGPNGAPPLAGAPLIHLTVHPPQTKTKNGLLAAQLMLSCEGVAKASILFTLESKLGGERGENGSGGGVRGCARYEGIIGSRAPPAPPLLPPLPPCSALLSPGPRGAAENNGGVPGDWGTGGLGDRGTYCPIDC